MQKVKHKLSFSFDNKEMIELSNGAVAIIDSCDYYKICEYCWTLQRAKHTNYAITWVEGKRLHMHRVIMELEYNDDMVVDHIDFNGLNNSQSNLRVCSRSDNIIHTQRHLQNQTGYRGVRISNNKQSVSYNAIISKNGKQEYLGSFPTAKMAAFAYNEAAKKYHGEFATLNHIKN